MACFTPKNNAYCSPNVNAFLDAKFRLVGNEVIYVSGCLKILR